MKLLNLKTIGVCLVLAFAISNSLWNFAKPDNVLGYPVVSIVLLQALMFFLAFLYGLVFYELRQMKRKGIAGPQQHNLAVHKSTLQIVLSLLTGTILLYPEVSIFFSLFCIVLLATGLVLYFKTKDKMYRSMFLWGLLLLMLMYGMVFKLYGIENMIA